MNTQLSHAEAQERATSHSSQALPPGTPVDRKQIIVILSLCMALQMTSFVIILPLFARRFSELGAGVELLGISAMAYALAATVAAPFMGALADRLGRRRLVLASLAAYVLAFIGYRFAASALAIILIRALAGAFTAGLMPAAMGIVSDLAPVDRRAQWVGFVNGGASIGWIAGPVLGGVLYDHWGYAVALSTSILMAGVAFLMAYWKLPETRQNIAYTKQGFDKKKTFHLSNWKSSMFALRSTLPESLSSFFALLFVAFAVMFAWAFIEPRFMFYAYDNLHWSSSMLGLVMSTYGIAMAFGEFGLSRSSDRLGRKPIIILGVLLFLAQFIGLALFRNYIWIAVSFIIAGLGNALYDPALSASILDIAPAEHQARNLGIKSTAASLGNILGPALVVVFNPYLAPKEIFLTATGLVCLSILFLLFVPIQPRSVPLPELVNAEKYFAQQDR
jgi:MFS family permease